ncbi:membrane protein FAM174B-like [Pseudomyrmex gracilis]|uniref:membrane protein FAM174B-like n=1 Tax=Pseudomyrmex gracilis TaxID=219809 RepID=UPI000994BE91|nr:membrane protein FAM174B-like [Pseudomyrmex gracilis]
MTRSKIQKMKFFIFLLIFLLAQTAVCDGSFREKRDGLKNASDDDNEKVSSVGRNKVPADKDPDNSVAHKATGQQNAAGSAAETAKKPTAVKDKSQHNITSKPDVVNHTAPHIADKSNEQSSDGFTNVNTGALARGFLVFLGLSVLVIAYMVFRSFRLSKTRAQLVRKYGVLTHRQDVEMRPLPLEEEDDEDTTVFDASSVVATHGQHQHA